MLYYLVRPLARIALRIFLRRISISHAERVPVGKPVILAVNHPTAFMEPCILACFLGRPLYFLVRGDVFSTPLVSAILRMLHMLPMYRLKDRGYQFVKENFQTLDVCFDALSTNKTIMILAEGTTIAEKRLRPLKKGAARLAFGALDKYPKLEDVWVVPVGVNFDYMDRFRAGVMIDIGQPLSTRAYYGQFQANSQTGIEVFNETLRKRMEALMVLIPRVEDEWLTEQVLQTARSGRPMSCQWQIERTNEWLLQEKRLAAHVWRLGEQEKNELTEQCSDYLEQLKALKVNDRSVVKDSPVSLEAPFIYVLALPVNADRLPDEPSARSYS
jgi:glycerol-3-phosphate O-acyltransferase / dihydroxyacetone phosphate acyltransferase